MMEKTDHMYNVDDNITTTVSSINAIDRAGSMTVTDSMTTSIGCPGKLKW